VELSRRPGPSGRVRVVEYADGEVRRREDRLATEEPLELRLAWPGVPARRVGVTMRTPGHDFELATGLLHAEGALVAEDVATVAYCTDQTLDPEQELNVVTVTLRRPPRRAPGRRTDTGLAAASACGVCGTQSIAEVAALAGVRATAVATEPVPADVLRGLPDRLRPTQRVFASTGGLHAAALFDAAGEPLVVREDVGRHNAVDKAVGARLLAGQPTAVAVLLVSGRAGFEIVQKAVAAGVGVLAAIGAPSSLAVRLAEEAGLCTVGFLSSRRFVVYSAPERVAG
jgi:FdhD protein